MASVLAEPWFTRSHKAPLSLQLHKMVPTGSPISRAYHSAMGAPKSPVGTAMSTGWSRSTTPSLLSSPRSPAAMAIRTAIQAQLLGFPWESSTPRTLPERFRTILEKS